MVSVESDPLAEDAPLSLAETLLEVGVPAVHDTTELRWFYPGPLPADVASWFAGSTGVRSERCDTYSVGGRHDVGVKRRFGETLELKVRRSLSGELELADGLAGSLEVWRRWSPADGLVELDDDGPWIDVCKSIIKRRFTIDGTEIAFTSDAQASGAGCDIEVAEVTVGSVKWWTLAFAAFGPEPTRRDALLTSWQGLMTSPPGHEPFFPRAGRAMGYPEWLARLD